MGRGRKKVERKRKFEIVFDAKSRREFVTGFRKRKNERRQRAKDELERLIKDERKRIRQEVRDGVQNMKQSYQPIPELEELTKEDEYEDEDVTVKIVELSKSELADQQHWIGENRPSYNNPSDNESDAGESDPSEDEEDIPGMSITKETAPKNREKVKNDKEKPIVTKKDLNKITKKRTIKSIEKSKFFKMQQKLDKLKNKKMARREKRKQITDLRRKGKRIRKKDEGKYTFRSKSKKRK